MNLAKKSTIIIFLIGFLPQSSIILSRFLFPVTPKEPPIPFQPPRIKNTSNMHVEVKVTYEYLASVTIFHLFAPSRASCHESAIIIEHPPKGIKPNEVVTLMPDPMTKYRRRWDSSQTIGIAKAKISSPRNNEKWKTVTLAPGEELII